MHGIYEETICGVLRTTTRDSLPGHPTKPRAFVPYVCSTTYKSIGLCPAFARKSKQYSLDARFERQWMSCKDNGLSSFLMARVISWFGWWRRYCFAGSFRVPFVSRGCRRPWLRQLMLASFHKWISRFAPSETFPRGPQNIFAGDNVSGKMVRTNWDGDDAPSWPDASPQ